jgi:ankyrin repeat protein
LLAAANGHGEVVSLLIASDTLDVNSKDEHNRISLSWVVERGHEVVVKQLLMKDDIDLDSKGRYGQTPLTWAETNRHSAIINPFAANDLRGPTLKNALQS